VLPEPPPPREDVAWHEASHAVAYHAFDGEIESVTVVNQPQVVGATDPPSLPDKLVMLLAGPAAQALYHRQHVTLQENELADYAERVDDVVFGNCDHCRAMLVATVHAIKTDGNRAAIFRAGERRANEFVRRRPVWLAIRALAGKLMEHHTIAGPEAHVIIEQYVKFGEFVNAEEDQEVACR
jgi:hypothetical protein